MSFDDRSTRSEHAGPTNRIANALTVVEHAAMKRRKARAFRAWARRTFKSPDVYARHFKLLYAEGGLTVVDLVATTPKRWAGSIFSDQAGWCVLPIGPLLVVAIRMTPR